MEKITFECETITPMFLAGADGRTPELRAASVKGALRFWWRAMHGDLPIKELREQEAEIFGGSGEGQGRSKVIVRVEENLLTSKSLWNEFQYKERKSKNGKMYKIIEENYSGIGYIFYSVLMLKERSYFKTSDYPNNFKIIISTDSQKTMQEIINVIFIFQFFGALGTRAHRGAGNFKIYK